MNWNTARNTILIVTALTLCSSILMFVLPGHEADTLRSRIFSISFGWFFTLSSMGIYWLILRVSAKNQRTAPLSGVSILLAYPIINLVDQHTDILLWYPASATYSVISAWLTLFIRLYMLLILYRGVRNMSALTPHANAPILFAEPLALAAGRARRSRIGSGLTMLMMIALVFGGGAASLGYLPIGIDEELASIRRYGSALKETYDQNEKARPDVMDRNDHVGFIDSEARYDSWDKLGNASLLNMQIDEALKDTEAYKDDSKARETVVVKVADRVWKSYWGYKTRNAVRHEASDHELLKTMLANPEVYASRRWERFAARATIAILTLFLIQVFYSAYRYRSRLLHVCEDRIEAMTMLRERAELAQVYVEEFSKTAAGASAVFGPSPKTGLDIATDVIRRTRSE